ncbi:phosphotransferase family protein [Actinomadura opuntiae]|uniref:phosphotransferase family protein n=1 Tax=Actinomadura sp. OS1-43 TaxID=604315 RepID=UPI00255AB0A2|nr:phosphotransferase family protein [Actinomadura sp. OS1-43]MDL4821465.1 phosphotransferase family protein [Actinomadura sp. OS1-43]
MRDGRAAVPGPPGIDAERVGEWLASHVEGLAGPVAFGLVSGGRSNLTYRVTDAAGAAYALRRPPTGGVLETAHDMGREWRFISAMAGTGVPVAQPLAFCDDAAVTGAPFYVMGFVDGIVLTDRNAAHQLTPEAKENACESLVRVLVALHAIDPHEAGLGDMVRRTGFAERQLRRWLHQAHQSGAEYLPLLVEVHDLLAARVPEQGTGIVHGDYRPGNLAFGPDGTVRAVFDWELATSGDALADLGYLLSTWQEPDDPAGAAPPGPTTVPGFASRADLAGRYARLSGRDVSDLPYWVAFAQWRSACIGAGVQARYLAGHMADDGYLAEARERASLGVELAEKARAGLRAQDI